MILVFAVVYTRYLLERKRNEKIKIWILYLVLSIIALIVAFPFIWLVITSLKTYPDIYHFPIIYWPSEVTWEHYATSSD